MRSGTGTEAQLRTDVLIPRRGKTSENVGIRTKFITRAVSGWRCHRLIGRSSKRDESVTIVGREGYAISFSHRSINHPNDVLYISDKTRLALRVYNALNVSHRAALELGIPWLLIKQVCRSVRCVFGKLDDVNKRTPSQESLPSNHVH